MDKKAALKETLDWIFHISIAVILALVIIKFLAQVTVVNGNSMTPSLENGDRLVIEKISPRLNKFSYGDIVTIDVEDKKELVGRSPIIKRVIGVEGDTVEVTTAGSVFVNGKKLLEKYINGDFTEQLIHYNEKVEKGNIFVMGDNRFPNGSTDSRILGQLKINKVTGKVLVRIFPFKRMGTLGI